MLSVSIEAARCPDTLQWQHGETLTLGSVLGSGSFSTVRAVRSERRNDDEMAAKVVEVAQAGNEAAILRELDHPNIVKLLGCIDDVMHTWQVLLLQRAAGGELFERVQLMEDDFEERLAATWMRQLLGAVGYCHGLGIVHRDIKPENLLLASHAADAT